MADEKIKTDIVMVTDKQYHTSEKSSEIVPE
jgi:hypothetical protein